MCIYIYIQKELCRGRVRIRSSRKSIAARIMHQPVYDCLTPLPLFDTLRATVLYLPRVRIGTMALFDMRVLIFQIFDETVSSPKPTGYDVVLVLSR